MWQPVCETERPRPVSSSSCARPCVDRDEGHPLAFTPALRGRRGPFRLAGKDPRALQPEAGAWVPGTATERPRPLSRTTTARRLVGARSGWRVPRPAAPSPHATPSALPVSRPTPVSSSLRAAHACATARSTAGYSERSLRTHPTSGAQEPNQTHKKPSQTKHTTPSHTHHAPPCPAPPPPNRHAPRRVPKAPPVRPLSSRYRAVSQARRPRPAQAALPIQRLPIIYNNSY